MNTQIKSGKLHFEKWILTRLGSIAEINPKLFKTDIDDGMEVSFLPMKSVEEVTGKFDLTITKKYTEVKRGLTPFTDGDIIFAKITPCMENGKIAIIDGLKSGIGYGSTEFHVIRLPDSLPKKYFFFFLIREDLRKDAQKHMIGSAGQLRVPTKYMQQIAIPLPPLEEQKRIVAKIEELFTKLEAGVEGLKKVKAQLKRYRQSVLKYAFEGKFTEEWRKEKKDKIEPASVLLERIKEERKKKLGKNYKDLPPVDAESLPELPEGWSWTRAGDVFGFVTSGSRGWARYYSNSGPTFLRIGNLNHDSIALDLKNIQRVKPPHGTEGSRTRVMPGDILISITADVGMVAVVSESLGEAYVNQHIALARPVNAFNKSYIAWFLASREGGQAQFLSLQRGATKMGLGLNDIRAINIPLPPMEEQLKIVEEIERRLSAAGEAERVVDQSLRQAERLRQSILKRAFEGKLVPQDPNDEPAEKLLERIRAEKAVQERNKKKGNGSGRIELMKRKTINNKFHSVLKKKKV